MRQFLTCVSNICLPLRVRALFAVLSLCVTVPLSAMADREPGEGVFGRALADAGAESDPLRLIPEPGIFILIATAGLLFIVRRRM